MVLIADTRLMERIYMQERGYYLDCEHGTAGFPPCTPCLEPEKEEKENE